MSLQRGRATVWVRLSRLLAFVAVLALVVGLHPPHAGTAGGPANHSHFSDHSHFSASCVKAEVGQPSHAKTGAAPSGHVDCHQLFHPLTRAVPQGTLAFSKAALPLPSAERARQRVFTFDPPPPRAAA